MKATTRCSRRRRRRRRKSVLRRNRGRRAARPPLRRARRRRPRAACCLCGAASSCSHGQKRALVACVGPRARAPRSGRARPSSAAPALLRALVLQTPRLRYRAGAFAVRLAIEAPLLTKVHVAHPARRRLLALVLLRLLLLRLLRGFFLGSLSHCCAVVCGLVLFAAAGARGTSGAVAGAKMEF